MSALRLAVLATLIASSSSAFAETVIVETGDDAESALRGLEPGDELVFGEGTHSLGQGIAGTLDGQPDAPITVRGAGGAILESSAGSTTLRLEGSNILLQDLELHGPGVALELAGEELTVRGLTFVGATTGIECEDCASTTIQDCEFRALTSNTGAAVHSEAFVNGVVNNNWIHDVSGDGIALVGRTVNADITNNVVEAVGGNGIEVAMPLDLDQANTILGNYVGEVDGDGVVATGPTLVSTNIITDFGDHGIWVTLGGGTLQSEAAVTSNTVVGDSTCFRGTDWSLSPLSNVLANNALYCPDNVAIVFDDGGGETNVVTNVFDGGVDRQGDSIPGNGLSDFVDADARDFYPAGDSPLLGVATRVYASNVDFNGEQRDDTPDVGAYERRGDNPDVPGGGFKGETGGPGGVDAGGGGGGGGGDAGTFGAGGGGGTSGFPEREGCSCSSAGPVSALLPLLLIVGGLVVRRRK